MKKETGFSLVELLVTVVIAAILLTVAVPSFSTMVKDNRITSQVNDLVASLNFTRSEAIKRGAQVSICKSSDGAACATAGQWDAGWIVFVDGGTAGTVDGTDTVLQARPAIAGGNSIIGTQNFVSYVGTGYLATPAVTLTVCDDRGDSKARAVAISTIGRIESTSQVVSGTCP